jgi:carboxyl-terminal processing protease
VEAPKDEQIANSVKLSESTLNGAFSNPGPLGRTSATKGAKPAAGKAVYSPPMKADIIGTPQDAQLKAALSYLNRSANAE